MFKQALAAFVALSSGNPALAQTAATETAAPPATTAPTTAAPAAPAPATSERVCPFPMIADSVALEPIAGSDLMTVPVEINGKPKQFLLDIGTNPSEVSQATVSELNLPRDTGGGETLLDSSFAKGGALGAGIVPDNPSQGMTLQGTIVEVGTASGGQAARTPIRIGSLTIGGATGRNMQFVLADDAEMGKSKPYDGLLTASFFRQYDVELDFGGKKLNFLTPTSCTDPDQVVVWPHSAVAVIPTTNLDGKIQVQVTVQGHSIPAIIDTSSARTVMRRDVAELVFGFKAGTPDMMPDGDVRDGIGQQVYQHTFPQISFSGGVTAYNVPALIQINGMVHNINRTSILGSRATFAADPRQRIPSFTLGMDVLHQLHLYVVPGQQKLYVTAAQ